MGFPIQRLRRLRTSEGLRKLVKETELHPSHLVMPIFVVPGTNVCKEIKSLPGIYHFSADMVTEEAAKIYALGIPAVLLFGVPDHKDEVGSPACDDHGVVQQAVRNIKSKVPNSLTVPDLCFCEYTSHGHCGVIHNGTLDNDKTLSLIAEQSISHARAGADIIAPSGMVDGMVATIRQALDQNDFKDVAIMSYSAKYSSAYYGPFREAVNSAPQFGDRKSYQMDPANKTEALREVALDIEEGADIVMVKPALAYLDIIHAVKEKFQFPTAAYNVSGEYSMIKAAAERGWIDEARVRDETLLSIRRAGADIIITYFAKDIAKARASS